MPNPIAAHWWSAPIPADWRSNLKEELKNEWKSLNDQKGHQTEFLKSYIKEQCELYNYPLPETDEEYCFYISYWPLCITEYLGYEKKKPEPVDEKIILHWWKNKLSLAEKISLQNDHKQILSNPDKLYTVNHILKNAGYKELSATLTTSIFYLCYLKNIPPYYVQNKEQLRKKIEDILPKKKLLLVTPPLIESAQNYRETLNRAALKEKFKDFAKNIHHSVPAALGVALLGTTAFTLIKTKDAVTNIYHGKKRVRNFWYLSAIGGGGYGGWLLAGLIISSCFPGIGILAYVALLVGAMGGACLARVLAKPIAQFVSMLKVKLGWYGNEYIANPPSPDKYRPHLKENSPAKNAGIEGNRIAKMLGECKKQKDLKVGLSGNIPSTESYQVKKEINGYIKKLQEGDILPSNIPYYGKFYSYQWQVNTVDGVVKDTLEIKPRIF